MLGDDDGAGRQTLFAVTDVGTFEHGSVGVAAAAATPTRANASPACARRCWPRGAARPQPGRDDKVVTAWNGFAITALAEASVALGRPEFAQRRNAMRANDRRPARRRRPAAAGQSRRRVGDSAAILEDHAALATGLLTLYQLTGDGDWLAAATGLLDVALDALRRSRP